MSGQTVPVGFFPLPASASCCEPGGAEPGGADAACDCGLGEEIDEAVGSGLHPNDALVDCVETVHAYFGPQVTVAIASYTSNAGIYASIDSLNGALVLSGKDFLVSPANFYTFIGTVGPIVTVGGRIAFTRRVPDWAELRESIEGLLVRA